MHMQERQASLKREGESPEALSGGRTGSLPLASLAYAASTGSSGPADRPPTSMDPTRPRPPPPRARVCARTRVLCLTLIQTYTQFRTTLSFGPGPPCACPFPVGASRLPDP